MLKITRTLVMVCVFVLAAGPVRAQRRSSVITLEDIERTGADVATAYDAVRTLRPRWLEPPRDVRKLPESGQEPGIARVHVFLNDVDQGEVEYLKTLPAREVFALRWMSADEAATRLGPSIGPVIVVTLKR